MIVNPGYSPVGNEPACRGEVVSEGLRIVGLHRPGTFAELVVVPVQCLAPKPAHLSWDEAGSLTVAHLTAFRMLVSRAALKPGETVLIHGIGGRVALAALQIARLAGGEVIVTSSSDVKLMRAAAMGAAHTLNYRTTPNMAQRIRETTGGRGVDVVVDSVGAATWPLNLAVTRREGRVAVCGVTSGSEAATNLLAVCWNQVSILGSAPGSWEDFSRMLEAVG